MTRALSKKGQHTHAPTLAGHGPGVTRAGITHQHCVDSVVNYIQQKGLKDIVIVGHSFGGTVLQRVAQQAANRIARMIFVDALVLDDGECVFDNLPPDMASAFTTLASASSDNTMLIPWEIWRDNFMQDAPGSEARSVWERLSPEPNQVNMDKLELTSFPFLDIPRSLIHCRQDMALPPGYFHPRMSSRLGKFKLIEMDGGHEVMFTRPAELADKIIQASSV